MATLKKFRFTGPVDSTDGFPQILDRRNQILKLGLVKIITLLQSLFLTDGGQVDITHFFNSLLQIFTVKSRLIQVQIMIAFWNLIRR